LTAQPTRMGQATKPEPNFPSQGR